MGLTCRHGQGLPDLDMKQGEAYRFRYQLFKHVESRFPQLTSNALMYDIGCKFEPWLKKKDPDPFAKTTVGMSALHVYGHALSCQIRYGPRRLYGVGESDSWKPTSEIGAQNVTLSQQDEHPPHPGDGKH